MEFNEYQEKIVELDLYPNDSDGDWGVMAGLVSEVGEVNNIITKLIRGDKTYTSDDSFTALMVKKELGDVLWFLTTFVRRCGFTMEEVAQTNLDKLFDRKERDVLRGDGDDR